MNSKPARRTQAERSASTRAEILKAAVHSLYHHGYAATTTLLVAKEAGVSRGAMLHHFPTKIDLMLYVVQAVYEEELVLYRQRLGAIADPVERRRQFTGIVWDVLSRPSGVAVLEIMQGSRSDPELVKQLAPLQARIERDSITVVEALTPLGAAKPNIPLIRLVVWAIRGLSIANVLIRKPSEIAQSVELLNVVVRHFEAAAETPSAPQKKKVAQRAASTKVPTAKPTRRKSGDKA